MQNDKPMPMPTMPRQKLNPELREAMTAADQSSAFAPAAQRMSKAAAQVAQHFEELELTIARQEKQLNQANNQLEVAREQLAAARLELRSTIQKLDYYRTRYTEIKTKLSTAGGIILDALRDSPVEAERTTSPEFNEVEEAIKELHSADRA